MTSAKVALRPNNEAPRAARWQGRRGTTIYVNNSDIGDSITALRLQRLRLLGVIGARAALLAALAWEGTA